MILFSAFLLSIALNLETLRISLYYGIKKIHFSKSITIILSIITSFGIFISMYMGKIIFNLFNPALGNIFGATLLSFTGIYFIVEYIRIEKKLAGYDTSCFFMSSSKYKDILENPDIIATNKSNRMGLSECLNLSLAFILNNIYTCFSAGITGVSINSTLFFIFILTIFSVYFGYFNSCIKVSKWFNKYSNLVSGVILIILGIFEAFV